MTITLLMKVQKTGHYVVDGKTNFIFEGICEALNTKEDTILRVSMDVAERPVDRAQLALIQPIDTVEFVLADVYGTDTYFHASHLMSIKRL